MDLPNTHESSACNQYGFRPKNKIPSSKKMTSYKLTKNIRTSHAKSTNKITSQQKLKFYNNVLNTACFQ